MVIQNKYTNKPIQDYREGKISKEEASTKIKNIYAGGGGGSSKEVSEAEKRGAKIRAEAQAKQAEAQAKQAEAQAKQAEAQAKQAEAQRQAELQRQQASQSIAKEIARQSAFVQLIKNQPKKFQEVIDYSKQQNRFRIPDSKGIYDSRNKVFIEYSPTGPGSTGYIKPPSPDQMAKIENAQKQGSYENIMNKINQIITPGGVTRPPNVKTITYEEYFNTYNLNPANLPEKDKNWLTPENIRKPFTKAGEITLSGGEFLSNIFTPSDELLPTNDVQPAPSLIKRKLTWLKKKVELPKDSWLLKKVPMNKKELSQSIGDVYLFSAFSPFMQTGTYQQKTAQESKYVYDYNKGKFVKKADVKEILETPKLDVSGKKVNIKDLTYSDKADRISKLLASAKDEQARKLVLETAKETYGENFIKDYVSQEFGYIPVSKPTITSNAISIPTTTPKPSPSLASSSELNIANLDKIPFIQSGVKESNYIYDYINGKFVTKSEDKKSSLSDNLFSISKQDSKQDTSLSTKSLTISLTNGLTRLKNDQNSLNNTSTIPKIINETITITRQNIPKPRQPEITTPQIPKPRQPEITTPKKPEKIKDKKIPIPFISSIRKPKFKKKRPYESGEEFIAITKRYGKEIVVAKTKDLGKAISKGKREVLGGLGATLKIMSTKGRQIALREDRLFRTSKKNPLSIVQRQSGVGRLASPGEKREIKLSKKRIFKI